MLSSKEPFFLIFPFLGRGTSGSFGLCGSSVDDCYIYSGRGDNSHICNDKEYVPYSTRFAEGPSFSFDKGNS